MDNQLVWTIRLRSMLPLHMDCMKASLLKNMPEGIPSLPRSVEYRVDLIRHSFVYPCNIRESLAFISV